MQSTHARKQAAKMTSSSLPPPFRPAAGDRALCINKYAEESIYISRLGRNKHCSIALSALTVSRIATFPVGDVAISAIPHVSLVRSSSNCWSERQRRVPAARECFSGSSSLERREVSVSYRSFSDLTKTTNRRAGEVLYCFDSAQIPVQVSSCPAGACDGKRVTMSV